MGFDQIKPSFAFRVPHFGGAWKTIVNELHVDHRARLGNLPNSKECQIFLGVMQNNILN